MLSCIVWIALYSLGTKLPKILECRNDIFVIKKGLLGVVCRVEWYEGREASSFIKWLESGDQLDLKLPGQEEEAVAVILLHLNQQDY